MVAYDHIVRAAILDDYDASAGKGDPLTLKVSDNFENMWIMDSHEPDYEPTEDLTVAALAVAAGVRPQEILLDALLEDDGHGVIWCKSQSNYDSGA